MLYLATPLRCTFRQRLYDTVMRVTSRPGNFGSQALAVMILGLALSLVPVNTFAGPYSQIFVFGDSLSDIRNLFILTDNTPLQDAIPVSLPYFAGRFSNGPVWAERLAEMLNLELRSFLAGGTNYAFGGAETALDVEGVFGREVNVLIPSVRSQVSNLFLGRPFSDLPFIDLPLPVDDADPNALYVVWGGANNLRRAVLQGVTNTSIAERTANSLVRAVEDLAESGAVHFLVPGAPDLGQTPESAELTEARRTFATTLSEVYNNTLTAALHALETESAISISRLDTFALLDDVINDPEAFGLTNVTDACLTVVDDDLSDAPFVGGEICDNPESYLFWDFIHPTATTHTIIAEQAFSNLPPVIVTSGEQNPSSSLTVSTSAENLPVLQMHVGTTASQVSLTRVALEFSDIVGDATQVERLQARLIHDTNANGRFDAGETILATRTVQNIAAALMLNLTPPLAINPATALDLLVTLDINAPNGQRATLTSISSGRRMTRTSLGMLGLLLPILGVVLLPRHRQWQRLSIVLVIFVCGFSLVLPGCTSDNNSAPAGERLRFTVGLQQQGTTGQTATSGPFAQPVIPIGGATVRLLP